jgi:hypothetical protein
VDAPHSVLLAGRQSGLRHGGGVNQANQPAPGRWRRRPAERPADHLGQPVAAMAQPVEHRDVGNIGKPGGAGPRRGRAQAALSQAIRQDQLQQEERVGDPAGPQERLGAPRAGLDRRRPAKPVDNHLPVLGE